MDESQDVLDRVLVRRARVRLRRGDGRTSVRLAGFSPLMVFLATLVIGVVLASFAYPAVAMMAGSRPVPLAIIVGAGALIVVLALLLALRKHRRVSTGDLDLAIDDARHELVLPRNFGRERPIAVSMDALLDIAPAEESPADASILDAHTFGPQRYNKRTIAPDEDLPTVGHRGEARFIVVVEWRDEAGRQMCAPVVRWSELRRANAFAHWLCRRVGLPACA